MGKKSLSSFKLQTSNLGQTESENSNFVSWGRSNALSNVTLTTVRDIYYLSYIPKFTKSCLAFFLIAYLIRFSNIRFTKL